MIPHDLYFRSNSNYRSLPSWCYFFLELGYSLATYNNPEYRTIVGLALPTRAYAAALIATGISLGSLCSQENSQYQNALERFQSISNLPLNTELFYRTGNKRIRFFFDGLTNLNESPMLRFNTGSDTRYIPLSQVFQIEFPQKISSSQPKRIHTRSYKAETPFLNELLSEEEAKIITGQSILTSIIIGSINYLEAEINKVQFAHKQANGNFVSGTLQEILRIRRFTHDAQTYRSEAYYPHSHAFSGNLHEEKPMVTIYDGSSSYLKRHAFSKQSHAVVLLDQTESEFEDAVETFNMSSAKFSIDTLEFIPTLTLNLPLGIPMAIYQENRR